MKSPCPGSTIRANQPPSVNIATRESSCGSSADRARSSRQLPEGSIRDKLLARPPRCLERATTAQSPLPPWDAPLPPTPGCPTTPSQPDKRDPETRGNAATHETPGRAQIGARLGVQRAGGLSQHRVQRLHRQEASSRCSARRYRVTPYPAAAPQSDATPHQVAAPPPVRCRSMIVTNYLCIAHINLIDTGQGTNQCNRDPASWNSFQRRYAYCALDRSDSSQRSAVYSSTGSQVVLAPIFSPCTDVQPVSRDYRGTPR